MQWFPAAVPMSGLLCSPLSPTPVTL